MKVSQRIARGVIDIVIKIYCLIRRRLFKENKILFYGLNVMNYNMFRPIVDRIIERNGADVYFCFKDYETNAAQYHDIGLPKDKILSLSRVRRNIWDSIFMADFIKPKYFWRNRLVYTCHGVAAKKWSYIDEHGQTVTDDYRYNPALKDYDVVLFHNEVDFLNAKRRGLVRGEASTAIIGMCCLDEVIRNCREDYIDKMKSKLIPPAYREKKVIMYAPTWGETASFTRRGKEILLALGCLDAFIVVKPHPLCITSVVGDSGADLSTFLKDAFPNKNYILLTDTPYDVIPIVDMMITDFGSLGFEYTILERPIFLFEGRGVLDKVADKAQYNMFKDCCFVFNEDDNIDKYTFKCDALDVEKKKAMRKLKSSCFSNVGNATEKAMECLVKRKILDGHTKVSRVSTGHSCWCL